ncbi:hypothetical protein BH10PSE17_BH10PSE17_00940 [soil metagenome]
MKLSLAERLTLANQFRILTLVDKEHASTFRRFETIVVEGYEKNYPDLVRGINKRGLSEEDGEFVIRVFEMYERIQQAYKDAGVEPPESAAFAGFDGAHESDLVAYADYVLEQEGKFTSLRRAEAFNTGIKRSSQYRNQLQSLKKLGRGPLTVEQVEALLAV